MAYIGHEPERETLKYRCPAKYEGWECPMSKIGLSPVATALRAKPEGKAEAVAV